MPAQYQLGIDIRVYPDGVRYMDIENFYFYPKSNIWGSFSIGFFRIDEKESIEIIEKLKLQKVEVESINNPHIHYQSKARIRANKYINASADYWTKKRAETELIKAV